QNYTDGAGRAGSRRSDRPADESMNWPVSRSIPHRVQSKADDPVDQLRVGKTRFESGLREIFVLGENRIRVCFNEINLVVRREAQIKTRVAVNREEAVDALADLFDPGGDGRINSFGESVLQSPAFPVFLVPLGLVGGDLRLVGRHLVEHEFANRKNLKPVVAEDAHIEFAALDVLLGDCVVVIFLVDELDAFLELFVRLNERRLRNAVGRLLFQRFYEDGELKPPGPSDAFSAGDGHKVRCVDAVVTEDLLGNALVLAKGKSGGPAAGERQPLHFEE